MKHPLASKALRLAVGAILGAILCFILIRQVDLSALARALREVNVWWAGAALVSVGITFWVRAIRWRILLGAAWTGSQLFALVKLIAIGQALNAIAPARTGELVRAYLSGPQDAPGRFFALGTIVAEKLLDMVIWLVLAAIVLSVIPLPHWVITGGGVVLAFILMAILLLTILRALMSKSRRIPAPYSRWLQFLSGWAEALWAGIATLRRANILSRAMLWSVVLCGLYLFNNWAIFRALSIEQGLPGALLALVILQVGIAPPSTPAKIGVFEYLCVIALGLLGIEGEISLVYGILLHLVVLLPPALLVLLPIGPEVRLWRTNRI